MKIKLYLKNKRSREEKLNALSQLNFHCLFTKIYQPYFIKNLWSIEVSIHRLANILQKEHHRKLGDSAGHLGLCLK